MCVDEEGDHGDIDKPGHQLTCWACNTCLWVPDTVAYGQLVLCFKCGAMTSNRAVPYDDDMEEIDWNATAASAFDPLRPIPVAFVWLAMPFVIFGGINYILFDIYDSWSTTLMAHVLITSYLAVNTVYTYGRLRRSTAGTPIREAPLGDYTGFRFCKRCNEPKNAQTHHCSVCDKCIPRLDHHCIFTNACVGQDNRAEYLLFILHMFASVSYVCLLGVYQLVFVTYTIVGANKAVGFNFLARFVHSIRALHALRGTEEKVSLLDALMYPNTRATVLALSILALSFVTLLAMMFLLGLQLYTLAAGKTYFEYLLSSSSQAQRSVVTLRKSLRELFGSFPESVGVVVLPVVFASSLDKMRRRSAKSVE